MGLRRQLLDGGPDRHDAVTADGSPANLQQIDFIKVQTGVNAKAPLIGEISTEVCGIGCYRTVTKRN